MPELVWQFSATRAIEANSVLTQMLYFYGTAASAIQKQTLRAPA
jgi:hypothetical protein